MTNKEIGLALQILAPGKKYSIIGDDYDDLIWYETDSKAPTKKQIQDIIAKLPEIEAKEKADRETAKAALLNKLGITESEAQLLLS